MCDIQDQCNTLNVSFQRIQLFETFISVKSIWLKNFSNGRIKACVSIKNVDHLLRFIAEIELVFLGRNS